MTRKDRNENITELSQVFKLMTIPFKTLLITRADGIAKLQIISIGIWVYSISFASLNSLIGAYFVL